MSLELKRPSENTVTVFVNGDIDMRSSTKMRDILAPCFQENIKQSS
jgi:hypothetical protein